MKIVIQCAGKKKADARHLTDRDGVRILFVAKPEIAPPCQGIRYACPDDTAADGKSWGEWLREYNAHGNNPHALTPAYKLYNNPTYEILVKRYGASNIFVLSAGWGIIGAQFYLPVYDITFSTSADAYKCRGKRDNYRDLCMLRDEDNDDLVFFGGKGYQPLFRKLTENYRGNRFVFYNSATAPDMPGCALIRYKTRTRTNWHYRCATDFAEGKIDLPASAIPPPPRQ